MLIGDRVAVAPQPKAGRQRDERLIVVCSLFRTATAAAADASRARYRTTFILCCFSLAAVCSTAANAARRTTCRPRFYRITTDARTVGRSLTRVETERHSLAVVAVLRHCPRRSGGQGPPPPARRFAIHCQTHTGCMYEALATVFVPVLGRLVALDNERCLEGSRQPPER